jgi:hypothetical protein
MGAAHVNETRQDIGRGRGVGRSRGQISMGAALVNEIADFRPDCRPPRAWMRTIRAEDRHGRSPPGARQGSARE